MELEDFDKQLNDMGINGFEAIDTIRKLYMVGRFPYERGYKQQGPISVPVRLPHATFSDGTIDMLRKFKLINDHSDADGSGDNRTWYLTLTDKGKIIGSQITHRTTFMSAKNILSGLIDVYPPNFLYVLLRGTLNYSGRLQLTIEGDALKRFSNLQSTVQSMELQLSGIESYDTNMKLDKDDLVKLLKTGDKAVDKFPELIDKVYPTVFCKFMLMHPKINERARQIFDRLSQYSCAEKVPVFGSKGQGCGDAYFAPFEVLSFILNKRKSNKRHYDELKKLMRHFSGIFIILKGALDGDFNKKIFLSYIRQFGLTEEFFANFINEFSDKTKAIYRYNVSGGPDDPIFIKRDEKLLEREMLKELDAIAHSILNESN